MISISGGIVRFNAGGERLHNAAAGRGIAVEGIVGSFDSRFAYIVAIEVGKCDGNDQSERSLDIQSGICRTYSEECHRCCR